MLCTLVMILTYKTLYVHNPSDNKISQLSEREKKLRHSGVSDYQQLDK
jgi:hypothetical protein